MLSHEPVRAMCGGEARFRLVKALYEVPARAFHLRGLAGAARVDPSQAQKLLREYVAAGLCEELPGAPFRKYRAAMNHPLGRALAETFADGAVAGEGVEPQVDLERAPVLRSLLWTGRAPAHLSEREAFRHYENNWRFVRDAAMGKREKELLERLTKVYGKGVING